VWKFDGTTWTLAIIGAEFTGRINFAAFTYVDHNTLVKMAVYGGTSGSANNDLWTSTDGVTWTNKTNTNNVTCGDCQVWQLGPAQTKTLFKDGNNVLEFNWTQGWGSTCAKIADNIYSSCVECVSTQHLLDNSKCCTKDLGA